MNNPALYKKSNELQRRDTREILAEFGKMINWRKEGQDSLLDIGCGDGDVTIDYILPLLPKNFERLIGVDLSEQMIYSARENYAYPNVSFEIFNAEGDVNDLLKNMEPVDHITSFYCLHWVEDQRKSVENIYNLQKIHGDCLLIVLIRHPIFTVYEQISRSAQWGEYMQGCKNLSTQFQNLEHDECMRIYKHMLKSCKFKEYIVEVREKYDEYDDAMKFKNHLKSVNPFYNRIPTHKQENYFGDLINAMLKMNTPSSSYPPNTDQEFLIRIPYKLMIVYAKK